MFTVSNKNHTHVKKPGHTSESVWYLLINLKDNYLFIKTVEVTYKKCKNFNIYNVVFLFKKLKLKTPGDIIILHLCTKNLDDMIYSSWVWQTEIGNYGPFLPFISPKNPKNQNFEKMKKIAGYHHFTRVSKTNHIKYGSWNMEWDEIFCHFGPFFTL